MYLSSDIPKHGFNCCKNIKNARQEVRIIYSFINMEKYLLSDTSPAVYRQDLSEKEYFHRG
jgi:hypothetical protein